MIQIRNVPDDVHRELKVRAARAGMSLSDFLNAELARIVTHRPLDELVEELGHEPALSDGEAASAVRSGRRSSSSSMHRHSLTPSMGLDQRYRRAVDIPPVGRYECPGQVTIHQVKPRSITLPCLQLLQAVAAAQDLDVHLGAGLTMTEVGEHFMAQTMTGSDGNRFFRLRCNCRTKGFTDVNGNRIALAGALVLGIAPRPYQLFTQFA